MARILFALALVASLPAALRAQTIHDGIMLSKGQLFTGGLYTRESWDEYWEGSLKRENDNIGTVTTQVNTWYANYGVTNRLNVIGAVPYVWTRASQGVLHGIDGFQDLTLAAKFNAFERSSANAGALRAIGVVSVSIPLTNYNPELPPLSIGSGSTRVSWRGTLNYQTGPGLYLNGSTAYTWRLPVTLDRPYFYTDDEFVMSDEVDMPGVFDYVVSAGYAKRGLMAVATFSQQRTTGGGDIRRQDMPFVSNRMNFSKVGGMGMYPIPKLQGLAVELSYAYTINGPERRTGHDVHGRSSLSVRELTPMRMPRTLSLGLVVAVTAASPSSAGQAATGTDAGAGNWRMITLTGPTQFVVPAPAQTSSADYQAELAAIKNAQSRLTPAQRKIVDYWGDGGVIRWNEILMGLVSRYNLPPAPNPDDTYPVPDANNPFADPNFPFANPPYAARAYSYVTVAQFEALKAAWYYKYLYNRPSPARHDSGIKALTPVSDLPAYPSEDAVMSAVNAELMKLLFPASVEEITLKAGEQRQAALLSGRATASDIAAGVALGQAVAAVFVARAGGDGMRTAGGSPALWQSLADRATARGEIAWKSMDSPAAPADAPGIWQCPGLDDDAGRHRQ